MFRRQPKSLDEVLGGLLRQEGLEAPLQQRRLLDKVDTMLGPMASRHVVEKYIRNQTLYVRMDSPVMRAELTMRRSMLVARLNAGAGSMVITDIRFC